MDTVIAPGKARRPRVCRFSFASDLIVAMAGVAFVAACSQSHFPARNVDGGAFVLPDSGMFYDARAWSDAFVAEDSGPYTCDGGCADGQYCGCALVGTRMCGCFEKGGYLKPCDIDVEQSCIWPHECVRARKIDGVYTLCSDGSEGTPCSPALGQDRCKTSLGCVCMSTPLGVGCACKGDPGPNPLYCDPRRPETCPGGTCVHVDTENGVGFDICSHGTVNEPCDPARDACTTSLGCTCPIVAGRLSCRCSEPARSVGEACDPKVNESCLSPLICRIRARDGLGDFYSECMRRGNDGGTDPFACDPLRPLCPTGYQCVEEEPNVFRCRPVH